MNSLTLSVHPASWFSAVCVVLALSPSVRAQSDACASATLIVDGTYAGSTIGSTNDGSANCGLSSTSPDVWYKYTAAQTCTLTVETCGSRFGYDTVLSIHSACPGTTENQIACNDDFCLYESSLTISVTTGTTYVIRVAGYNGMTGNYILNVVAHAPSTAISGRVVFEDGLTPVPNVTVFAFQHGTFNEMARDRVDANGRYEFPTMSLPQGQYDVVARYTIPDPLPSGARLVHDGFRRFVLQPYDLSTEPDLIVAASGPSPTALNITFPWPTILLHGVLLLEPHGPQHFREMQPYLAIGEPQVLHTTPRRGVIPLVPDLMSGTYDDYYAVLGARLPEILTLFPLSTRFNIVGYSQGGLVARLLVEDSGANGAPLSHDRIKGVFQLATPNAGTCVARGIGPYNQPYLTPEAISAFNDRVSHGYDVPFYLLAGTLSIPLPGNVCLDGEPDDTFVPVSSVFHLNDLPDYDVRQMITTLVSHSCEPPTSNGMLCSNVVIRALQRALVRY